MTVRDCAVVGKLCNQCCGLTAVLPPTRLSKQTYPKHLNGCVESSACRDALHLVFYSSRGQMQLYNSEPKCTKDEL